MRKLIGAVAASAVAIVMTMSIAIATPVGAKSSSSSTFCTPARVIADQVAKPALSVSIPEQAVLIKTLQRTAKNAPHKVANAMKTLAKTYTSIAKAATDADRTKVAYTAAVKYQAAQRVFADYYSTKCGTVPVKSPNLPGVQAANQMACLTDMRTLQIAETEYSTLNGEFATMSQLTAAGLLKAPSVYHAVINVGSPPGGYTIVGNQGCNDVPVAG